LIVYANVIGKKSKYMLSSRVDLGIPSQIHTLTWNSNKVKSYPICLVILTIVVSAFKVKIDVRGEAQGILGWSAAICLAGCLLAPLSIDIL
jgi:hypothetical protein